MNQQLAKCCTDPKQMITLQPQTCRAWKPSGLPWVAKKSGFDSYLWFVIFNAHGDEIFTTGKVMRADEDQAKSEVLLLLSSVNKSDEVRIDDTLIKITWI